MFKKALSFIMALSLIFSVFSINSFASQEDSEIYFSTEIIEDEGITDTNTDAFSIATPDEDALDYNRPVYGSCKYYKVKTSGVPFFMFFLFFMKPRVTITNNSSTAMYIDVYDSAKNPIQSYHLGGYERGQITLPKRSTFYISCSYADSTVSGNMLASVSFLGNSSLF